MADLTVKNVKLRLVRHTTTEWASIATVPLSGAPLLEDLLDSNGVKTGEVRLKIGDGANVFANLPYVGSSEDEIVAIIEQITGKLADLDTEYFSVDEIATLVTAINALTVKTKVEVSTTTTTQGYLKSYTVRQNGQVVAVIDIPKDLVVTGGKVVTVSESGGQYIDSDGDVTDLDTEGTYLKLRIANQDSPIYINVASLAQVYTALDLGTNAGVQVAISATNEISATIKPKTITKQMLDDEVLQTQEISENGVVSNIETPSGATAVNGTINVTTVTVEKNATTQEWERVTNTTAVPVFGLQKMAFFNEETDTLTLVCTV